MATLSGIALPWSFDPLDALRRWPIDRPVLLLHSGRADPRWARRSILAQPQAAYRFDDGRSSWIGDAANRPGGRWLDHPLHDLGRVLRDDSALWIGYLGYDVGRFIEELPCMAAADRDWPLVQFHRCPGWLEHDAITGRWCAHGTWSKGGFPPLDRVSSSADRDPPFTAGPPTPSVPRQAFEAAVRRVIDYIAAGDVFQVNLAQRFSTDFTGSPRTLYRRLATASPAWYGAYLECLPAPEDDRLRIIASTSPELFLELDAAGGVVTRPIKGTRPASACPESLRDSEKDCAELAMIVDLLRNDLGRFCAFGSVRVEEPRAIETHPTVHHGVATIRGRLREDRSLIDLLTATMPGGSITGAPKVRAMQIIDELEPVRRGPYCGAIGYVQPRSATTGRQWPAACLNLAIRTMLIERDNRTPAQAGSPGRVDFSVGGGIVSDSVPADEYQETLDKAAAMLAALRV